jgi:hypothetical protein
MLAVPLWRLNRPQSPSLTFCPRIIQSTQQLSGSVFWKDILCCKFAFVDNQQADAKLQPFTMNNSNDQNSAGATVKIRYLVMCGKPTSDGLAYPFEYSEQAPLSLCNRLPSSGPDPDPDATGQFITSIVDRHNAEILTSRPWLCQVCDRPAGELLHSAIARLSPGLGATAEYVPFIWDTVVPICRSGGDCDRTASEWAEVFGKEGMPTLQLGVKVCERCGKVTGVKLCSGCKVLA